MSETTPRPVARMMTYEEFLEWADEDTYAEWVDGEVILLSPASRLHQRLISFLTNLIPTFVEYHHLGEAIPAPFQMKTGPDLPGREPDVLFVANEHLDRFKVSYLDGPADLVVEVVSRKTRTQDREKKYVEYEKGGVREYWLIDPDRRRAEFYLLGPDGVYRPIPVGEDGIFRSAVLPGLWLKVDWFWQDPLPPVLDIFREWKLI